MAFCWHDIRISDDLWYCVNTDTLVEYIEKYGVSTLDRTNSSLCDFLNLMSYQQLDIIIDKYKINPMIDDETVFFYDIFTEKGLYIVEKMFRNDHDYRYVRCNMNVGFRYHKEGRGLAMTVKQCLTTRAMSDKSNEIGLKMLELYENHEKKCFSLFELMLPWLYKSDKKARFH